MAKAKRKNYRNKQKPVVSVNQYLQQKMLTHPGRSSAALSDIMSEWRTLLANQYNDALQKHAGYPSPSDIRKADCVDMRELFVRNEQNPDALEATIPEDIFDAYSRYAQSAGWFAEIPCLPEGTLRIADTTYFYFQFKRLDVERQQMELKIIVFIDNLLQAPIYQAEIHVTLDYSNPDSRVYLIDSKSKMLSRIYTQLNTVRDCQWNSLDNSVWEKSIATMKAMEQDMRNTLNAHSEKEFIQYNVSTFLEYISFANAMMARYPDPVETDETTGAKSCQDPDKAVCMGIDEKPRQIVRAFGGKIRIKSAHMVGAPVQSCVSYAVPTWMTRGHIRRYKSGKQVYVRPHMNTRHGMESDAYEAQTIFRLKKGTENDHD